MFNPKKKKKKSKQTNKQTWEQFGKNIFPTPLKMSTK